jgi:hypothetical protein
MCQAMGREKRAQPIEGGAKRCPAGRMFLCLPLRIQGHWGEERRTPALGISIADSPPIYLQDKMQLDYIGVLLGIVLA